MILAAAWGSFAKKAFIEDGAFLERDFTLPVVEGIAATWSPAGKCKTRIFGGVVVDDQI